MIFDGQLRSAAIFAGYDAITDPERWGHALDRAVEYFGAKGAIVGLRQDNGEAPYSVMHSSELYREALETPKGQYYIQNLLPLEADDWRAWETRMPRQAVIDSEIFDDLATREVRADYVYLRENFGVRRRVGYRFNMDRGWHEAGVVVFSEASPGAIHPVLPHIERVMVHFAKAAEVARSFLLLRARYQAVFGFLDRLPFGVVITLADGQVILENAEAKRFLEQSGAVYLSRGRQIRAAMPDSNDRLVALISQAAHVARGSGVEIDGRLRLTRRDGRAELLVEVAPIADSCRDLDGMLTGALILMIDPSHPPVINTARVAILYGLTVAEAGVLKLLTEGHDTPAIAEIRSTSQETVRNQIRAILAKTGTHSRAGLFLLLLRTAPTIL